MDKTTPQARPRRPVHIVKRHIPSGTLYASNFNGTQHPLWGETQWDHTPHRQLLRIAHDLVDGWNRQQPANTIWAYTLGDGPAPEGREVRIAQAPGAALPIPTHPVHFVARHQVTGKTHTSNFNGTHHPLWSETYWQETSPAALIKIAESLVQKWNEQRNTTQLHYRLEQGPAPLAAQEAEALKAYGAYGEDQRPVHFVRRNRLTGEIEAVDFHGSHRAILSESVWRTRPREDVIRCAAAMVEEWNARAQDRDIWEYSLAKGPAPAPAPQAPIPGVPEPQEGVAIAYDITAFKARIGAELHKLGWTAIDSTAVALKGYETVVGIKEAHAYVEDWGTAESKVILTGNYLSEGHNVLQATFVMIPKAANNEEIAQLCRTWAENADKKVDESFARGLFLRRDPLEEEAKHPPVFRRPSIR